MMDESCEKKGYCSEEHISELGSHVTTPQETTCQYRYVPLLIELANTK